MRVLVTGGNGLVGRTVVRALLQEKISVRSMDLRPSEIEGVQSYVGSILDTNNVAQAVRGCDVVIHLAAMLGVEKTEAKRLETLNLNILGTLNVLDACVKSEVSKIVFSSSSEVYGDQLSDFISEESMLNPKSVYAITKLAGEEYVRAYHNYYGIDFTILRFFSVYGPGQVAKFVLAKFIKAVGEGKSPLIYGDGSQVRSFCYVDDVAQGTVLAAVSDKANGEILNIGNNNDVVTILQAGRKVIEILDKDIKPKFIPFGNSDRSIERDISKRIPDISKARSVLGFKPQVSLEEGIARVHAAGSLPDDWIESM